YSMPPAHSAILALYSLIFLLGVLGNGAVIWVTSCELRRTVNGVWFLNLALADLLCCLALPFLALPLTRDHHWPLGGFACKLLPSLTVLNMFASVLLLTALSADRCALVTRPVWCQNHRSPALARVACASAWGLAAFLSLPSFIFRSALRDPFSDKVVCALAYQALGRHRRLVEVGIASVRLVCGFLLPLLGIAACYGLLLARLRAKGLGSSRKATRTVLVVVLSFFACWLPYHVVGMVLAASDTRSSLFKSAQAVDPLVAGIAYLNSCLNPIIYVVMGQDFRERFWSSWRVVLRRVLGEEPAAASCDSRGRTQGTAASEER
ncbi:C5AR1 protein, partial [Tricholaema leucomelas]|nr:C5AR1 protein [Tricholaema leucomelas]